MAILRQLGRTARLPLPLLSAALFLGVVFINRKVNASIVGVLGASARRRRGANDREDPRVPPEGKTRGAPVFQPGDRRLVDARQMLERPLAQA